MSVNINIDKPLISTTPGVAPLADTSLTTQSQLAKVLSPWLGMTIYIQDTKQTLLVTQLQKQIIYGGKFIYKIKKTRQININGATWLAIQRPNIDGVVHLNISCMDAVDSNQNTVIINTTNYIDSWYAAKDNGVAVDQDTVRFYGARQVTDNTDPQNPIKNLQYRWGGIPAQGIPQAITAGSDTYTYQGKPVFIDMAKVIQDPTQPRRLQITWGYYDSNKKWTALYSQTTIYPCVNISYPKLSVAASVSQTYKIDVQFGALQSIQDPVNKIGTVRLQDGSTRTVYYGV